MANIIKKHLPKKAVIKAIKVFFALLTLYILITLLAIYIYLKQYGYGINELPKTAAVYFHISKGFTVEENENDETIFIGSHNYIYEDVFAENGYYESDRGGAMGFYNKSGNEHDPIEFCITSTGDWCHWFRVYEISNARIEDFI